MLLAEIHGKGLEQARNSEDYLTSAVFGHLRYVPPQLFWQDLFGLAVGGEDQTLALTLAERGCPVSAYASLRAWFWRSHPSLGEPDLLLLFSGGGLPPLAVLVEVKLWSPKGGAGEGDQLARYLAVLDDLDSLGVPATAGASGYLVYLTPRDARAEAEESLRLLPPERRATPRLFRLRWQDVSLTASRCADGSPEPARTILADVARFLARLGLDHFDGFARLGDLPPLGQPPPFAPGGFSGFWRAG